MRLAVISDLHIGSEQFAANRPHFADFLAFLEATHDEIIVLGDLYECYFPTMPWGASAAYTRFAKAHPEISERLKGPKYCILSGNHDIVARRKFGIPSHAKRSADGMRIYLAHGHEVEAIYRSAFKARAVETYMWFAYRLKVWGLPQLYDYGYRVDYENNMRDGGQAYVAEARRIISEQKYDVVIFGHTHLERHIEFPGGGTYINSGDCLTRKMYVSIDTVAKNCEVRYFQGARLEVERVQL